MGMRTGKATDIDVPSRATISVNTDSVRKMSHVRFEGRNSSTSVCELAEEEPPDCCWPFWPPPSTAVLMLARLISALIERGYIAARNSQASQQDMNYIYVYVYIYVYLSSI
ncbi:uncharacterized protein ARB_05865 [Trichophyton benhamiae CBS 112371]|uniref:Uncharacterized protein n=1 Tax=Arthroderma benhamiae (strain ATCC MYA-4681 / CBS 112371) TaxID=663331 RepID=D4ANP8_ARTBC|nr:uncharacterized protein ARB_05865 [Trichophyton benhamiae CBS 112371]EFE34909.1 hypothetical protein ARB_05865 [Trichophyton benhamiae CBS 112371]